MSNKIYVIGVGYRPLDKKAREIILSSNIILASNRLSEVFKGYEEYEAVKDKVKVINNVDETINFIKSQIPNLNRIVLLASGDPMFFGIGRRSVMEFGRDMVEIIPDLSCIQLAFSRLRESWDDAFLMSLHGGPDPEKRRRLPYGIEDIPSLLQRHNKIAILTDKENNPSKIARVLALSPISQGGSSIVYVCERLGYPDERITKGLPEEIARLSFSEPNVVILVRSGIPQESIKETVFGLTEKDISHSKGLITKDEVRAVTIHKLRPPDKGVLWDIGAGSGSVSIEVARMCPHLKVFAIEKDMAQISHIKKNKEVFKMPELTIIHGEAPEILGELPEPDRVFIGGNGGRLEEIIKFIHKVMPSGLVVINATTFETLNLAINLLKGFDYDLNVVEVNISRMKLLKGHHHMTSQNPVFIITGERA